MFTKEEVRLVLHCLGYVAQHSTALDGVIKRTPEGRELMKDFARHHDDLIASLLVDEKFDDIRDSSYESIREIMCKFTRLLEG